MTYKGYTGFTEVDEESGQLFGTVIGIRDVITFVGNTVQEARKSFEESIDHYLKCCEESGKKPSKPFSGQFLVRVDPKTHERLANLAAIQKLTLNDVVARALEESVSVTPLRVVGPTDDFSSKSTATKKIV